MAREYAIGQIDKPVVKLGAAGTFTLGELTKSRRKAVREAFEALDKYENREPSDAAEEREQLVTMCATIEAACEDAEGVAVKLADMFDEDTISEHDLIGLVRFVGEWLNIAEDEGKG